LDEPPDVTGTSSIAGKFMVPYLGSNPQLPAQTTRLKDPDQFDWSVSDL